MTREEAIRMLSRLKNRINFEVTDAQGKMDALNMAIKALDDSHYEDCISREQAKAEIRKVFHSLADRVDINSVLNGLPSVQPKTGHWVHDGYDQPHGYDWMHCSNCGRREPYVPAAMTDYCPGCGCRMIESEG